MNEEQKDDLQSLNEGGESEAETTEGESDPNAETEKVKEYARNQKIRAEKAEQELKQLKAQKPPEVAPKNDMSLKDVRALSDVHDDDVDDLVDYAKYKNITIAEAKKAPAMVNILKAKQEERKSAEAANTGRLARGASAPSADTLIEKARQGEFPETEEDAEKLAEARMEQRVRTAKRE